MKPQKWLRVSRTNGIIDVRFEAIELFERWRQPGKACTLLVFEREKKKEKKKRFFSFSASTHDMMKISKKSEPGTMWLSSGNRLNDHGLAVDTFDVHASGKGDVEMRKRSGPGPLALSVSVFLSCAHTID